MTKLMPSSSISISFEYHECYFKVSGLWSTDQIKAFLVELSMGAKPLRDKNPAPLGVMGDFAGFTPQTQETVAAIRNHLFEVQERGLKGVAILNASALVKMQYRRLSEGARVEFFDDKVSALSWLRKPMDERIAQSGPA